MELGLEKGNMETFFRNEQHKAACLIDKKGNAAKPLKINCTISLSKSF